MRFLLSSMSVVYVLTTLIPDDGDDATVDQLRKRAKWDNDDYVCRGLILNGMSDSLFDVYQNVESFKELWDSLKAKYMADDASSKKFLVSNFTNYKMTDSRPVLEQYNELLVTYVYEAYYVHDDDVAWWVDSEATVHVCKDRCWFKTYESLNDGSILHMGNEAKALVHGRGCADLKFSSRKIVSLLNVLHVQLVAEGRLCILASYQFRFPISYLCDLHDTPSLGNNKYFVTFIDDASRFCYVYLLHSKDEALDKFKVFKTEVELQQGSLIKIFRTDRGGLSQGFWGEAMLTACYLLNRVPNKRNKITPFELWTKKKPNLIYLRVWGCKAVARLPDSKLKTLGERGLECIFVGYAEHSKAFRDEVSDQHSYCFNVEDDPKTFDEAMKSQDVAFWKEAINDEMDSIMGNNTWVLADLPPGCKPLGCKWIFKRKLKVDGTIEKFKARLVIQGFKQKSGIDYFDTYAPVARISIIRLLIAMSSLHNLIIHQMDLKTTFLNGELEEEVYMNQPQGFIMPGNENKVCKLIKSLYGLKQAPKQWHQKFDEVVLSNGYLLNQADKCVYSKFDESGKGVIICLYVDDMLIFGTDQVQVDLTKEFLSSRFSMKDMGEADVILGIRIKHESNGIAISQSHYIEKVLKKFNYFDCTPMSTLMDTSEKLMPNNGQAVSQLEYSRVIGCLMHVMTCTRPDIAFVVGKMSRYTSNPGTQHWQAIQRVLKYLKKTMDYKLTYTCYPSVLEGYTDASWISNTEDNSSTSGWVFLLSGGAIYWASKKQTCITGLTIESEFVALAAAGKEAEWLRNLILEIPLWSKPIAPIFIRCDSDATLAKAYSQMYNEKSRHLVDLGRSAEESSHRSLATMDWRTVMSLLIAKTIQMFSIRLEVLHNYAKAGNNKYMTTLKTLDEQSFLGAENKLNLFSLQRKGEQLEVVGQYHHGEYVNRFCQSSVNFSEVKTVIFGAASGGIGVLKQDEWRSDFGKTSFYRWRSSCICPRRRQ
ncbi:zinc finger, CCHC-type containing protein [Tanacetum coccineum]